MRTLYVPLLLLTALACGGSSPSVPEGGFPFTTLEHSKIPGATGPRIQTVVRDDASWSRVWNELWSGRPPQRPVVDFRNDMVVLVTASEFCFGAVEIEAIDFTGNDLLIRYADAAPTICLCAQAELVFHAVRAPRVLGNARFAARLIAPLC